MPFSESSQILTVYDVGIQAATDFIPAKEQLTGAKKSLYWLSFGLNSDQLYQGGVRNAFTQEIAEQDAQREFVGSLQSAAAAFPFSYTLTHDEKGALQTIVGPYTHATRGRSAVALTYDEGKMTAHHVWVAKTH